MPFDIKISETDQLGTFLLTVSPHEMVRLKNIAVSAGTEDIRSVLEEICRDGVRMCSQLLEAKYPDLAAAIHVAAERRHVEKP